MATKLSKAGGTMTGVIDMGGNIINDVANPTLDKDVANKLYVDTSLTNEA